MTTSTRVFLFIWFYVGWFGCVYFAKHNFSLISLLFPIVSFLFSYFQKVVSTKKLLLLISMALIGYAFDWIFYSINLISFPLYGFSMPPVWLLAMWSLFVSVLPLMEIFFFNRPILAAILAGVFGPLSYYAGASFQVLFFTSNLSLVVYCLFWGISFPLMIFFQRKIA